MPRRRGAARALPQYVNLNFNKQQKLQKKMLPTPHAVPTQSILIRKFRLYLTSGLLIWVAAFSGFMICYIIF
jgi:hypothetical protein